MEKCCSNCKFYMPINNRGQRYPKGHCEKHFAYRLSDKYRMFLSITSPFEYVCDLHEEVQQPIFALVDGELILVPPIIANDLMDKGWLRVVLDKQGEKIIIKKEDE